MVLDFLTVGIDFLSSVLRKIEVTVLRMEPSYLQTHDFSNGAWIVYGQIFKLYTSITLFIW